MSDLISRQEAIKAIEDLPNCYNGFSDTYDKACIIGVIEELPPAVDCERCIFKPFKNLPSAEQSLTATSNTVVSDTVKIPVCSECGCTTKMREKTNYCPNCGARMVTDEET